MLCLINMMLILNYLRRAYENNLVQMLYSIVDLDAAWTTDDPVTRITDLAYEPHEGFLVLRVGIINMILIDLPTRKQSETDSRFSVSTL